MARSRVYAGPRWQALRVEVLERDGYRCQVPECVCPHGRRIDPAARRGDPWGPEVDHVVEVARGGDWWDPVNLRAAHARCNKRRNAAHRHR